jgi:hypothetical protein
MLAAMGGGRGGAALRASGKGDLTALEGQGRLPRGVMVNLSAEMIGH